MSFSLIPQPTNSVTDAKGGALASALSASSGKQMRLGVSESVAGNRVFNKELSAAVNEAVGTRDSGGLRLLSQNGPALPSLTPDDPGKEVIAGAELPWGEVVPPGGNGLPPGGNILTADVAADGEPSAINASGQNGVSSHPDGGLLWKENGLMSGGTNPADSAGSIADGDARSRLQAAHLRSALLNHPADTNPQKTGVTLTSLSHTIGMSVDGEGVGGESVARMIGHQLAGQMGSGQAEAFPAGNRAEDLIRRANALTDKMPSSTVPVSGVGIETPEQQLAVEDQDLQALIARLTPVASEQKHVGAAQDSRLQQQSLLAGQFTSALAATDVNGTSSFGSAAAPLTNNGGAAVDSTMPSLEMSTPFKQAGWDKELGDRVMWMIKQDVKVAELKINPPQLGPLEMRVSVNQDQASVVFHSNHQMARDALEAAIPRLREMLADAGLNLADANVSSQSSSDQEQGYQSAAGNSNGGNGGYHDSASPEDSVEHTEVLHSTLEINGVVDLFA